MKCVIMSKLWWFYSQLSFSFVSFVGNHGRMGSLRRKLSNQDMMGLIVTRKLFIDPLNFFVVF